MSISIIIAHRNELDNLFATIDNIRDTASVQPQIIVVDDDSGGLNLPLNDQIRADYLVYNQMQVGPGASRHRGVQRVKEDIILFCDAHMRFPRNWDIEVEAAMHELGDDALVCSTYVSDKPFDRDWFDGSRVCGANLYHFKHRIISVPSMIEHQFNVCHIEPRHKQTRTRLEPVPCVIGACYFMKKDWYLKIGGLAGLDGYGGDEQLLSWMTWMHGGSVYCDDGLEVVHLTQPHVEYDHTKYLLNKLYVEWRVLGIWYQDFCRELPAWMLTHSLQVGDRPYVKMPIDFTSVEAANQLIKIGEIQTLRQAIQEMQVIPEATINFGKVERELGI